MWTRDERRVAELEAELATEARGLPRWAGRYFGYEKALWVAPSGFSMATRWGLSANGRVEETNEGLIFDKEDGPLPEDHDWRDLSRKMVFVPWGGYAALVPACRIELFVHDVNARRSPFSAWVNWQERPDGLPEVPSYRELLLDAPIETTVTRVDPPQRENGSADSTGFMVTPIALKAGRSSGVMAKHLFHLFDEDGVPYAAAQVYRAHDDWSEAGIVVTGSEPVIPREGDLVSTSWGVRSDSDPVAEAAARTAHHQRFSELCVRLGRGELSCRHCSHQGKNIRPMTPQYGLPYFICPSCGRSFDPE